jgi:hypothetical protein
MRILGFVLILVIASSCCAMSAQEMSFAALPVRQPARPDSVFRPQRWNRSLVALAVLDAATKTADAYATRRNIAGGGEEYNPLARPFVHTASIQVIGMAALFSGELASAIGYTVITMTIGREWFWLAALL